MTAVLHRVRDFFVGPAADAPVRPVIAARALPSAVAVLCAPGDIAAAHAVGLVLAARGGTGCAVVCRWAGPGRGGDGGGPDRGRDGGGPDRGREGGGPAGAERGGPDDRASRAPAGAFPAAAALARRLCARDLRATAAGRLALVDLPARADEAAAAVGHSAAAAGEAPLVVAVAGPRPAEFGEVLAAQDRVLVAPAAGAPEGMAELALVDASRASRGAGLLELRWGAGARALAARGLTLPRAVREATLAALEGRDG